MTHQDWRSSRQGLGSPFLLLLYPPCAAAAIQGTQPIQLTMTAQSSHQQREEAILLPRLSLSLLSAPAFRQPNTRPHQGTGLDGKKNQIHRKAQPTFSGAEMEGGTPPALCSHTSSHASSTNESKAVPFSSSLRGCQLRAVRSCSPRARCTMCWLQQQS